MGNRPPKFCIGQREDAREGEVKGRMGLGGCEGGRLCSLREGYVEPAFACRELAWRDGKARWGGPSLMHPRVKVPCLSELCELCNILTVNGLAWRARPAYAPSAFARGATADKSELRRARAWTFAWLANQSPPPRG